MAHRREAQVRLLAAAKRLALALTLTKPPSPTPTQPPPYFHPTPTPNPNQVRILSEDECRRRLAGSGVVFTGEMVCTEREFDPSGMSQCLSDLGGPLLITQAGRAVLVGLVSWGIECDQSGRRLADQDHAGIPSVTNPNPYPNPSLNLTPTLSPSLRLSEA